MWSSKKRKHFQIWAEASLRCNIFVIQNTASLQRARDEGRKDPNTHFFSDLHKCKYSRSVPWGSGITSFDLEVGFYADMRHQLGWRVRPKQVKAADLTTGRLQTRCRNLSKMTKRTGKGSEHLSAQSFSVLDCKLVSFHLVIRSIDSRLNIYLQNHPKLSNHSGHARLSTIVSLGLRGIFVALFRQILHKDTVASVVFCAPQKQRWSVNCLNVKPCKAATPTESDILCNWAIRCCRKKPKTKQKNVSVIMLLEQLFFAV